MKVTNSQIKSYQRCHRQFYYKVIQQLVPRQSPLPLKRGSWLHELLEARLRGQDWHERHDELTGEFMKLFEEEREIYGDLPDQCFRIMRAYEYRWRDEDSHLKVIAVEEEFEVELPHGHVMGFKVDGIVEDEWGMWLLEHKSHKSIPKDEYRFVDMQTAKYVWGLQKLGYPITGVLWDYLTTLTLQKPKLTQTGRLSRAKIRTDPITYVETIREFGLDPRDYKDDIVRLKRGLEVLYRRERVPKPPKVMDTLVKEMILTADDIERNIEGGFRPIRSIERSCERFCDYLPLCMTSLYGGDTKGIEHMQFEKGTKETYYGYAETALNE